MVDEEIIKGLTKEINHYADIMDVSDLGEESMKYCAAIGARVYKEIKKIESEEDRLIASMCSIEPLKQLQEATRLIGNASEKLKVCFLLLNEMKGDIANGRIN